MIAQKHSLCKIQIDQILIWYYKKEAYRTKSVGENRCNHWNFNGYRRYIVLRIFLDFAGNICGM